MYYKCINYIILIYLSYIYIHYILFSWALKSLWMVTAAMKLKTLAPWKKSYDKPRQYIKKQRHHFADMVHVVKAMVFPVVMYGCESWTIKNAEC